MGWPSPSPCMPDGFLAALSSLILAFLLMLVIPDTAAVLVVANGFDSIDFAQLLNLCQSKSTHHTHTHCCEQVGSMSTGQRDPHSHLRTFPLPRTNSLHRTAWQLPFVDVLRHFDADGGAKCAKSGDVTKHTVS